MNRYALILQYILQMFKNVILFGKTSSQRCSGIKDAVLITLLNRVHFAQANKLYWGQHDFSWEQTFTSYKRRLMDKVECKVTFATFYYMKYFSYIKKSGRLEVVLSSHEIYKTDSCSLY